MAVIGDIPDAIGRVQFVRLARSSSDRGISVRVRLPRFRIALGFLIGIASNI